jgi:2-polyprenyl-6-methoxyphenol hydroxylase-like FAD-dependent oxidoreductase
MQIKGRQDRSDSQRRIFLAGDAAHRFPLIGGHGMDSGIADTFDLGWILAGVLDRWGGEGPLEF